MTPVETTVPVADRQRLVNVRTATINDQPALIAGWRNQFATVRAVDHRGACAEWSWEAVRRIVDHREGKFYT